MTGNTEAANVEANMDNLATAEKSMVRALQQKPHVAVNPAYKDGDRGFKVVHFHDDDPHTDKNEVEEYFVTEGQAGNGVTLIRCTCPHHEYRLDDGERCKHMHLTSLKLEQF